MSYLWYWPAGGWDFDAWKARRRAPKTTSEQTGKRDPVPLVPDGASLRDWQEQREKWERVSREMLGRITDQPPSRMRWETLGETYERRRSPSYSLRRVRYTLTDKEWGYAWLLTPAGGGGNGRRAAAVIALHQTVPQGKLEPVGLEGDPELAYGRELAEQGFVVLAPDAIAFGERQAGHANAFYRSADTFFAAHPEGSVMAKMAYDTSRAVDLLQLMPEVDAKRIGCIGHSHGGYGTLFAMVGDERIRAGVISCGITLLRTDPSPDRWWRRTALIPNLGFYEGKVEESPIDFHQWLALIAPRPLMVSVALKDAIFPRTERVPEALEQIREVYRLHGAADKLHSHAFEGEHRFPREARTRAYRMLGQALAD